MTDFTAFHNDEAVKKKYLDRVIAHAKADEIIKGQYWEGGKGCAVGCTIHSSDHIQYETELGIPQWLARVEDTIFEGLPNERAKKWPQEFLESITPGQDLEKIKTPFIISILESCIESMDKCIFDKEKNPNVVSAVQQSKDAVIEMIRCHKEGIDLTAASSAASAARSAAWSAASAAESAAWSAGSAAASAAWSAGSAAWSVASAAWSAASAAWSAASAARSAAWSVARSAEYEKYADKLLELIKETQ